jgi:hypothetical protein
MKYKLQVAGLFLLISLFVFAMTGSLTAGFITTTLMFGYCYLKI